MDWVDIMDWRCCTKCPRVFHSHVFLIILGECHKRRNSEYLVHSYKYICNLWNTRKCMPTKWKVDNECEQQAGIAFYGHFTNIEMIKSKRNGTRSDEDEANIVWLRGKKSGQYRIADVSHFVRIALCAVFRIVSMRKPNFPHFAMIFVGRWKIAVGLSQSEKLRNFQKKKPKFCTNIKSTLPDANKFNFGCKPFFLRSSISLSLSLPFSFVVVFIFVGITLKIKFGNAEKSVIGIMHQSSWIIYLWVNQNGLLFSKDW